MLRVAFFDLRLLSSPSHSTDLIPFDTMSFNQDSVDLCYLTPFEVPPSLSRPAPTLGTFGTHAHLAPQHMLFRPATPLFARYPDSTLPTTFPQFFLHLAPSTPPPLFPTFFCNPGARTGNAVYLSIYLIYSFYLSIPSIYSPGFYQRFYQRILSEFNVFFESGDSRCAPERRCYKHGDSLQ